jgi:16S rRNA (guanine1207-N2)-methyltransferase
MHVRLSVAMPQYFDDPVAASAPRTVVVDVPGARFEMQTDRAVFSHGRLDPGTAVLLGSVPPPPTIGAGLDLGCGAGPLALTMALRSPMLDVVAIDVNERARTLCAANARTLQITNLTVLGPDEVAPDQRFDVIWSNPPVRIGKSALHELTLAWLERLADTGTAHLVIHKHLGADSFQRWLAGEGYRIERTHSSRGYRLFQIST